MYINALIHNKKAICFRLDFPATAMLQSTQTSLKESIKYFMAHIDNPCVCGSGLACYEAAI